MRGNDEDVNHHKNPGNFLALLKNYVQTDEILFNHLNSPRAKNATYTSPRSQNDIINIIGHDVILASIVTELKAAIFYCVIADEISSHC